jgi:hypothetical protein
LIVLLVKKVINLVNHDLHVVTDLVLIVLLVKKATNQDSLVNSTTKKIVPDLIENEEIMMIIVLPETLMMNLVKDVTMIAHVVDVEEEVDVEEDIMATVLKMVTISPKVQLPKLKVIINTVAVDAYAKTD